jgi:methylmalonyl-CoA mutase C-terminal domain/subunit
MDRESVSLTDQRSAKKQIRIVLAKPGLDDHQRALYVLSKWFRDAGMEVILLGAFQTSEMILKAAINEDADIIGLSCHTVSYFGWVEELINMLKERGLENNFGVVVGGTIPKMDEDELKKLGVKKVFYPGSSQEYIIRELEKLVPKKQAKE